MNYIKRNSGVMILAAILGGVTTAAIAAENPPGTQPRHYTDYKSESDILKITDLKKRATEFCRFLDQGPTDRSKECAQRLRKWKGITEVSVAPTNTSMTIKFAKTLTPFSFSLDPNGEIWYTTEEEIMEIPDITLRAVALCKFLYRTNHKDGGNECVRRVKTWKEVWDIRLDPSGDSAGLRLRKDPTGPEYSFSLLSGNYWN